MREMSTDIGAVAECSGQPSVYKSVAKRHSGEHELNKHQRYFALKHSKQALQHVTLGALTHGHLVHLPMECILGHKT